MRTLEVNFSDLGAIKKLVCFSDKDDNINSRCLWAVIYLDTGEGIMSATTDCGNYAYQWAETGKKFLKLMASVKYDYFLNKIAKRNIFDPYQTIKNIRECYKDNNEVQGILDNFESDMNYMRNEDVFILVLDDYDVNYKFRDLVFDDTILSYMYPYGAEVFANLFIQYAQPKIKEVLKVNGW